MKDHENTHGIKMPPMRQQDRASSRRVPLETNQLARAAGCKSVECAQVQGPESVLTSQS
jgi:hypothetical protein